MPSMGTQVQSQARIPSSASVLMDAKCSRDGSVKVKPCSVSLSASNPSTTVTVKAPKQDTVTESDNCGGETGVATVTQGPGTTWAVTAGTSSGSCTATFTGTNKHGKANGSAVLAITNSV